jgi:FixJ family two-component response regulator
VSTPIPPIFIVDDDPSMRRALKRLLKSAGFGVQLFESGEEFLHSPERHSTGCLILDIQMPGSSGFEVFDRLTDEGSPLSVIFLTAYPESAEAQKALESGAIAFLQKPFEDEELFKALEVALERAQ